MIAGDDRPRLLIAQKNQGYWTSSAGKIFHDGMDDPPSWTYPSNQTAVSNHSRQRLPDGFLSDGFVLSFAMLSDLNKTL